MIDAVAAEIFSNLLAIGEAVQSALGFVARQFRCVCRQIGGLMRRVR